MTNETTENFLKVMATFEWPTITTPSYRLYYNEDGSPKCYSMEEMPDKYIEVNAQIFCLQPQNVKVVDGKLTFIEPLINVQKLSPNEQSGVSCHIKDVCVIVSENQPHIKWKKQINEVS